VRTPFTIGVMADFEGRSSRELTETGASLASRKAHEIDPDTFDDVFSRLGVNLRFQVPEPGGLEVQFSPTALEDFHPDRIFKRLDLFEPLRRLRSRLKDPGTFDEAAKQVRSWTAQPEPGVEAGTAKDPGREDRDGRDLMEEILAAPQPGVRKAVKMPGGVDLDAFMRDVVSRHVEPDEDPEQEEMIAGLDAAISEQVRSVLRHPTFRALESSWRSLHWLMTGLETGSELKIFAIDISREELVADLAGDGNLESSGVCRLLVDRTTGAGEDLPWAVLVGDYTFDYTIEDAHLLGRIGRIASRAGAPFLAAASPRLLGCESLAATADPDDWEIPPDHEIQRAWATLRSSPQASHVGLCLPRFLLRMPYGERTDPIDRFAFEELSDSPAHEDFLWANPAFACARLLGGSFNRDGWNGLPGEYLDVDDLPSCTYTDDGKTVLKPCAETWLSERAIQTIRTTGLMPLVGFRDTNRARLGGFRSLSEHSRALAGRWGGR